MNRELIDLVFIFIKNPYDTLDLIEPAAAAPYWGRVSIHKASRTQRVLLDSIPITPIYINRRINDWLYQTRVFKQ